MAGVPLTSDSRSGALSRIQSPIPELCGLALQDIAQPVCTTRTEAVLFSFTLRPLQLPSQS